MTFVLGLSQAPHFSPYNGNLASTSRQYWMRPSQVQWSGPQIDSAIAGMVPGELRLVKAAPAETYTAYKAEADGAGTPYAIVDWTPFNAWHAGTQQVVHGGKRRVNKIVCYSDITGEFREEWQPRHPGDYYVGGHWYGETATDGEKVLLYDRFYYPGTQTWSARIPGLPGGNTSYIWLPNYGTVGGWMWGATTLRVYDESTNTVSTYGNIERSGAHELKCYHPVHDKVLVIGGGVDDRSTLIDGVTLDLEDRAPCPLPISMSGGSSILAHPSGCWWVLSSSDVMPRQMAVYWPQTDTWHVLEETWPRTKPYVHPTFTWDPVRQVVLYTDGDGLFAYRYPDIGTVLELTGLAVSAATATGTLTTAAPVQGAAAAVSVAGGVLTAQIRLAGAALATAAAVAALAGGNPLSGTGAARSSATGVLDAGIALAGDAAALAAATGALTIEIRLAGAAVAQALAAAGLTVVPEGLAGDARGHASAAAALGTGIPLAGAATARASAAGAVGVPVALAGAAAAVSHATGDLVVLLTLEGEALATALAAASLDTSIPLAGAALAVAAGRGALASPTRVLPEHRVFVPTPRLSRIHAPIGASA